MTSLHSNSQALVVPSTEFTTSGTLTKVSDTIDAKVEYKRTSTLKAPIMLLTGHNGEIFTCQFHPFGYKLASGSQDKQIFLWDVNGDCLQYGTLIGHTGAILDLKWSSDGNQIISASTDHFLAFWDAETFTRIKKCRGHSDIVNACDIRRSAASPLFVSASNDSTLHVWDPRYRNSTQILAYACPITSVSFSHDGTKIYSGAIDNDISVWDIRMEKIAFTLNGHSDTITGLQLSPDGTQLLSNAMDNTVRIWDIKEISSYENRCLKIFEGANHGYEKNLIKPSWDSKGQKIACGSADRTVIVWDANSRQILYKLPGHRGVVNQVHFHSLEPILVSCSNDRQIFMGELMESIE